MSAQPLHFRLSTPANPGALAVFDIVGDMAPILPRLVRSPGGGAPGVEVGHLRLVHFLDANGQIIDTGILSFPSPNLTQFMPHGGPRVMQKVFDTFIEVGMESINEETWSAELWPEAEGFIEALMLETLAGARSRDAVDLLLEQPHRWERYHASSDVLRVVPFDDADALHERSRILNRLLTPPVVVITGAPNVGKSTLTNALTGRSTSIALDLAGTTRDYVGSMIDLAGLTVSWFDTPGMRTTEDDIEAEAQDIAGSLIRKADLVIEAFSPDVDGDSWKAHDRDDEKRHADICVLLKADLAAEAAISELCNGESGMAAVSAQTGEGLADFVQLVRESLVPRDIYDESAPFIFDDRLSPIIAYHI